METAIVLLIVIAVIAAVSLSAKAVAVHIKRAARAGRQRQHEDRLIFVGQPAESPKRSRL